ncbi:hypothetical protein [Paenibacillus sp. y28]|uniref:hypothetical protein n=1 Tax=Paenibacillus sp. y28 TaxID=3129110 RepID=UPI003018A898
MTFSPFQAKIISILLVLAVLLPSTGSAFYVVPDSPVSPAAVPQTERSAVLLYGSFDRPKESRTELMALYSLLRSYCNKVSFVQIDHYKNGLLNDAQVVVIAGAGQSQVQASLGQDLQSFAGTLIWIGGGIERYAAYGLTGGFQVNGYTDAIAKMVYPLQAAADEVSVLTGSTGQLPKLAVTNEQSARAWGSMTDGIDRFAYAVQSGNRWVVAKLGSTGPDNPIFRDLLGRIFGHVPERLPQAYVKLNEVSPLMDLDKLEELAGWLNEQGVPFIVELRPVFFNTEYKAMLRYFKTVRQLQKLGGTPVLGNLEGWNPPDEWSSYVEGYKPAGEEGLMNPAKLMDASMRAYLQNNIYPLGFSGLPDALFDPALSRATAYFSTFVQNGAWQSYSRDVGPDKAWTGTYIPELLPVTAGTGTEQPETSFPALDRAESTPVLSFDSTKDQRLLQETVLRLKQTGVTFKDLRTLDSHVSFGDIEVAARNGIVTVNGKRLSWLDGTVSRDTEAEDDSSTEAEAELTGVNKRIKQTMVFVLVLAGGFVGLFLVAFIAGKRIDRKKHLR